MCEKINYKIRMGKALVFQLFVFPACRSLSHVSTVFVGPYFKFNFNERAWYTSVYMVVNNSRFCLKLKQLNMCVL